MSDQNRTRAKHLLNRASFGLSPSSPQKESLKSLFPKKISEPIDSIPRPEIDSRDNKTEAGKQRTKEGRLKSKENMMTLNLAWMEKLRTTQDPLREKMVLFWHNHFACRTQMPFLMQQQNNMLRKHALGSFSDMLMEVSKDPAMLQFLNNQQNRKGHPNENFAREVMELFTLSRGNYTENDIKEAARAFTGWGFNKNGEFQFREKQHDSEIKTFRGQTKNFSGDDIISCILEDKQTARFITRKIAAHLVSQDQIAGDQLEGLAQSFYKSSYDIGKLVKDILSSDWFYKNEFIGNRIKTPIELIIGIQHQTDGKFADEQTLIFLQRALSQQLFFPPNVGGWPKGKEWIDSSSLAFRMAMPQLIFQKKETEFQAKDDGDVNSLKEKKPKRDFSLEVNWQNLTKNFKGTPENIYDEAEGYLLSSPASRLNKDLILKFSSGARSEGELVKKIFTGLVSLPEYQLC